MIEKNINEALVKDHASAKTLITLIEAIDKKENLGSVSLYHQFPLYPVENGNKSVAADILVLSQDYGLIIFQCIDYSDRMETDSKELEVSLDELDRIVFAKILKDAPLLQKNRRELKINSTPAFFIHNAPVSKKIVIGSFEVVKSESEIAQLIKSNSKEPLTIEAFKDLKATIEGSKGISRPADRKLKNKEDLQKSKGAILTKIENDIYNFDLEQKRAALFIVDGAQRIRGLAGSGKTVILAMKAAMIHLQYPEADILYTYFTKALNDYVKRLVTRFYRQFAESDPDWDKIHIMHAWGGRSLEGVYYNACQYNNVPPLSLMDAKRAKAEDPFDYACENLIQHKLKIQYDYSLLDEAQDFPIHFYQLCRQITKNDRVVWAYDDFQNILDIKIQNEKETFGKAADGSWLIDFSKRDDQLQDIVLHKCYRNPRKILVSAFALGLGIYNTDRATRKSKIIQRLESNEHWESLGFTVEKGTSKAGDEMVISRSPENSPLLKNTFLDDDIVIKYQACKDLDAECDFVVKSVIEDLERELLPEDISIICLDNRNVKLYFETLERKFVKQRIKTFSLLNAPTDNIVYKVSEHITLSTIFKAKGNESGSVYIIGIDSVFFEKDDITERNKLFTAMTRSLAWITLTGIGEVVQYCFDELEKLKANKYKLVFTQPSEKDVHTIRQDINKKQAVLNKIERLADEIANELKISKEDVINEIKEKLLSKK